MFSVCSLLDFVHTTPKSIVGGPEQRSEVRHSECKRSSGLDGVGLILE